MKNILLAFALTLTTPIFAQNIFKCDNNGSITYTNAPADKPTDRPNEKLKNNSKDIERVNENKNGTKCVPMNNLDDPVSDKVFKPDPSVIKTSNKSSKNKERKNLLQQELALELQALYELADTPANEAIKKHHLVNIEDFKNELKK